MRVLSEVSEAKGCVFREWGFFVYSIIFHVSLITFLGLIYSLSMQGWMVWSIRRTGEIVACSTFLKVHIKVQEHK